jgi:zinc-ribbon domain
MIVCPECRHANVEEAQFCSQCGRSLAPGYAATGGIRRATAQLSELDVIPRPERSRWPFALVVLGLVAVGGLGWLLTSLRPDPCDGRNFTSERFGYCVTVPERWEAGPARIGSVAADEIATSAEAATVLILLVDLPQDQTLDEYAQEVRDHISEGGLEPGPSRGLSLDGVDALAWDAQGNDLAGREYLTRQVVTLKGENAWIITLSDLAEAFPAHEADFESILASWRFR